MERRRPDVAHGPDNTGPRLPSALVFVLGCACTYARVLASRKLEERKRERKEEKKNVTVKLGEEQKKKKKKNDRDVSR